MSNIHERAKKCAIKCIEWCYREDKDTNDENYVTHAIEYALEEQRKEDFDKAFAWLELACSKYPVTSDELPAMRQSLKMAMEG